MQVFLPPEASVTTTAAIVELLRFFTNAGSIKDAVDRIVAERERLVAAAEALNDLETRASALATDRYNLESSIETQKRQNDDVAAQLQLERAAFVTQQEDHRRQVAELAAARAAFEAEQLVHADRIAQVERLKGLLQG